jgi:superfamily II DNA helicase RecQ
VIPTGGGKTVTFVLPCVMVPGIAIVVSPLVMLMHDQVSRLRSLGINTCYNNILLSDSERQNILHHLREPMCQYQFVFVSPEAVMTEQFQNCLEKLKHDNRLSFFIIDEAHCIDTWGSDFCPAYQQLGTLRKFNVPFAALTGTATGHTIDVIRSTLQMKRL